MEKSPLSYTQCRYNTKLARAIHSWTTQYLSIYDTSGRAYTRCKESMLLKGGMKRAEVYCHFDEPINLPRVGKAFPWILCLHYGYWPCLKPPQRISPSPTELNLIFCSISSSCTIPHRTFTFSFRQNSTLLSALSSLTCLLVQYCRHGNLWRWYTRLSNPWADFIAFPSIKPAQIEVLFGLLH